MNKLKVKKSVVDAVNAARNDYGHSAESLMRIQSGTPEWHPSELRILNTVTPEMMAAVLWFPDQWEIEKSPEEKVQEMYDTALNSNEVNYANGVEDAAKALGYDVKLRRLPT